MSDRIDSLAQRSPKASRNAVSRPHRPFTESKVARIGPASSSRIDGYAWPSIFAVTPFTPTKVRKLMDTDFGRASRFERDTGTEPAVWTIGYTTGTPIGDAFSASFASLTPDLFSTRVLSNFSRNSSSINKSRKIGRHTFNVFGHTRRAIEISCPQFGKRAALKTAALR